MFSIGGLKRGFGIDETRSTNRTGRLSVYSPIINIVRRKRRLKIIICYTFSYNE